MGDEQTPEPPEPEFIRGSQGYVLEGEILLPVKRARGQRIEYDEDMVTGVVRDRVSGMTLHAVAEKWGIAHETVRRWAGEAEKRHRLVDGEKVLAARAKVALELEVFKQQAMRIARAALDVGDGKLALDALGRAESLNRSRATLQGLNAAVKIDATVTELSAAERELQEIIAEARAKSAADEAEVIRAASEDDDL